MPHSVSHFEINAQDAPATQRFYSELFGWGIDTNNPQNYGMIDTKAGRGIGGGIGPTQNGRSWVTFYVDTDDPVATLAKAERLGGRTVMPPMDAGTVTYALFADPEGNVIGLAKMQEQAQRPTRSQNGGTARARSATRAKTGAKNAKKKTTARGRTATTTRARSRTKRSRG